jgi:hypothetical protein
MNESLKDMHDRLLAQHNALAEKLGEETNPDSAKTILMEMREILHRIDLVQNLLFRETSKALENAVAKVRRADGQLQKAIKTAADITKMVKATAEFLKYVDKAIDVAKTLAIL